jgi:multidrug efflux pump subunit AcrA (membrane-fusion protein)
MEGQVDPSTRMVNVVVEVERPFERSENRPALMPGTFVDVEIYGSTLAEVVMLPRHAIREGGDVWVYADEVLEIREVSVMRSDHDHAYVSSGLADGERVIISSLDAVTDGMAVRSTVDQASGGAS